MYNQKRGRAFIQVVVVISILMLLVISQPLINRSNQDPPSRQSKCKANLTQLRTALTQYQLDLGRQVYFPQKQGQGFITTLYKEGLLVESLVYLCPYTTDSNQNGFDLVDAPELGDETGSVSYAGRINSDQNSYPGLFKISDETSTTPLVSDDFALANQSKENENHERGKLRNLLFLDGHTDHIRRTNGDYSDTILFDVLKN